MSVAHLFRYYHMKKNKLLVFHTRVEIYRVDFFNNLAIRFDMNAFIDNKHSYGSLSGNISHLYRFRYEEFNSDCGLLKNIRYVITQIRTNRPDIVMVSECGVITQVVVLYKLFLRKNFDIVSIIDDSFDQLTRNRHFTKRHQYAERVLIPFFSNIINVEPRSADYFQQKYNKGQFFPIISDDDIFREKLVKAIPFSRAYLEQYNLKNKKIILFVGRFVAQKNVISLIESIRYLHRNDVCLLLVGAGPEEKNYRDVSEGLDVIFTGSLNGLYLYAWYIIADVFVLPSVVEPFGAVVNEALMAGCKCVVSERAGSSCLIKDGENGFVINPLNKSMISQRIDSILNSNRRRDLEGIRPNLMPYTFKERFDFLMENLL